MTYKCNVLFVPKHRAPVVRVARRLPLPPSPSPRVHAHARGGTRMLDSIGEPREPYLCVPVLLCVTRIIRTLAPQPSRHLSSDLDKSKIAVAEVRPRIPHLSPFHFRESRAAKSRCCRVIVAPRGVAQFKSIGSRPAAKGGCRTIYDSRTRKLLIGIR